MVTENIETIKTILENTKHLEIKASDSNVLAAVMMILRMTPQGLCSLLIKRSTNHSDVFSGHMAFPGGKKKAEDLSNLETAYRETLEEVGIDLKDNSVVLGRLDDCNPSTPAARKFIVRPYVCYLISDCPVSLNEEVSEAIWIPVLDLKANYLENLSKYNGHYRKEAFEYYYQDYYIWGLTGRILNNFFSLTIKALD